MYAVVVNGQKQYQVTEGQVLKLEKLPAEPGEVVELDKVLLIADDKDNITIGAPYVAGAKVKVEVQRHGRDKKIKILKFKRRKHHMKSQGHRQWHTEIKVVGVENGS